MTIVAFLCCIWVCAAALVALLPGHFQFGPGLVLLCCAVPLIIWVGFVHGPLIAGVSFLGFGSMFRKPIFFIFSRKRIAPAEQPQEPRS